MKPNELMIGDLVRQKQGMCAGCVLQLTEVHELEHANNYEPIPITEEILKKNGFVQVDDGIKQYDSPEGAWQNDKFLYGLDYNHRGMFYTFSNDPEEDGLINQIYGIFFVHDLQHCLRLCELSDLADNFKV